jgi:RHS repeat-associated protein
MPDSPVHIHALSAQARTVLLATDRQQSVIAEVVGGNTGSIAYTAYGRQSAQQNIATSLGFNGELREKRVGWYLLGNGYRAYNPTLMRFHSPDSWSPFRWGGLNAYMYCAGDPINFSDPTGHVRWLPLLKTIKKFFSRKDSTYRPLHNSPSSLSVSPKASKGSVLPPTPTQSQTQSPTHELDTLPAEHKKAHPLKPRAIAPLVDSSNLTPMNARGHTRISSTPASDGLSPVSTPINKDNKTTNRVNRTVSPTETPQIDINTHYHLSSGDDGKLAVGTTQRASLQEWSEHFRKS